MLQARIARIGQDYNTLTTFRATQLKKLQQLVYYLTYGNTDYTDSIYDFACDGIVGGTAKFDFCGVCGGHNETCMDCAGTINGPLQMDICGVCGGEGKSCDFFCDGKADSGEVIDLCGLCGGNSTKCTGCDGIPMSGMVLDSCGLCGGDGSECSAASNDQQTSQNTTMLVVKLQLNVPFSPDWTAQHSVGLRNAVATAVNVLVGQVQLMSAGGTDTITVSLSISVDQSIGTSTSELFTATINDGSLLNGIQSQGITATQITVLDGPTAISQN